MPFDAATAHALHALFEAAAIAAGVRLYVLRAAPRRASFGVLAGCLGGAAVGNKLAFWLEMPQLLRDADLAQLLFGGQSMVGGLLGGLLGTEIAKALCGKPGSTGDAYVFPVLLAIAIGRVGCFLSGLHDATYGLPTALPWGVDFGDGLPRHPTQLYEIGFCAVLAVLLLRSEERLAAVPGLRFKLMLCGYLAWRLVVDLLKPVPYPYLLGLSGIQWLCLATLAVYLPLTLGQFRRLSRVPQDPPLPVL